MPGSFKAAYGGIRTWDLFKSIREDLCGASWKEVSKFKFRSCSRAYFGAQGKETGFVMAL